MAPFVTTPASPSMSIEMKTFRARGRAGCCAPSEVPRRSAIASQRGDVVIPGTYAVRLRTVRAEHESVFLQSIVAGETLLRRGNRGEFRLAVAGKSLESPSAARRESNRVLHH